MNSSIEYTNQRFAAIPAQLTARRQWVGFRTEPRADGRVDKIPVNPRTGRNASTTDDSTWASFEEAVAAVGNYNLAGVGYVFADFDSHVGIDIDHCRDAESGEIEPWAWDVIRRLDSYTELSVSGSGIHIFVEAVLPSGGCKTGKVEMYQRGRFFVVTGDHVDGTPRTIEPRQEELSRLHAEWFPRRQTPKPKAAASSAASIPEGRRHPSLVSLAGSMIRRRMGDAEIVAALLVTNAQRCQPPLSEEEVRRLVTDVYARYAPPDATATPEVPEETDLFDRDVPLRQEIVEGLIRESQLVVCGGAYGVGKSPFLQDLMVRVVHGLRWCGRTVEKRPVVYFDLESPPAVFKFNIERICARLGVPIPTPEQLGIYLEQDAPEIPSTAALLQALHSKGVEARIVFVREVLRRKPNALVIIDPLEMLFKIEKRRETEVLDLYQELRFVLAEFPESAVITTWNLRKRDKKGEPPDLLVSPREWLEEVSGSIEIMNRSDVRIGFDFLKRDPEIRVVNGIRRGEDFYPLLLRPSGVPPELEGFEVASLEGQDLCLVFTKRQLIYWRSLPREFMFNEVADVTVPRSSLWYLLERARSLGLIREQGSRIERLPPVTLPVSQDPDDFIDDRLARARTRGRKS